MFDHSLPYGLHQLFLQVTRMFRTTKHQNRFLKVLRDSPFLDVCPIATELVSISECVPSYKENHVIMLVNLTWPHLDKVFFVNKRKLSGA